MRYCIEEVGKVYLYYKRSFPNLNPLSNSPTIGALSYCLMYLVILLATSKQQICIHMKGQNDLYVQERDMQIKNAADMRCVDKRLVVMLIFSSNK